LTERVQFSRRARKDIERLSSSTRSRVRAALGGLVEIPPRSNVDIRPLTGRSPWPRLRIGDVRVILRQLTRSETNLLGVEPPGYLVGRVVDRRDLDDAVRPL
jgi:mRNA-degrading endonuclease RelE of RelBE toxin-antitoxin system